MAEEKEKTKTSEQDWKTPLIVIGSIVGLALIIGFIVLISNSGTTGNMVNEGFQDSQTSGSFVSKKNCRQEQVPYEEIETYYETVPYEKEVSLEYNADSTYIYNCGSIFDYYACGDVGITNTDTVGGTFAVNCKFRTLNDEFYDSQESYVKPGDRGVVTCAINLDITEDVEMSFTVTPPKKEETDYKEVQRTKTVTKYRTEEVCN